MKSKKFLVLACLVSMPVFSQGLPDEINHAPYETRFRSLERDTSQALSELNKSRTSLAEIKKFISDMTKHVSALRNEIVSSQNEINRLQNEIPELERKILSLQNDRMMAENDLRDRQNQLSNLEYSYQQAFREIRPLEDLVNRKEERLRTFQMALAQEQRALRAVEVRYNKVAADAQRIDEAFERERNHKRSLENQFRTTDQRIASTEAEISRNESVLAAQRANLEKERTNLATLDARVKEYSDLLASQRASNAPARTIQDTVRKLSVVTKARNSTSAQVKGIQNQVAKSEARTVALKKEADQIRNEKVTLPQQIAQSEARQIQLSTERGQIQPELGRLTRERNQAINTVNAHTQTVEVAQADLQNDQISLQRQRALADNIARDAQMVRNEVTNLSNHSRSLSTEIVQASDTIRSHQMSIPRIEQSIGEAENKINEGELELARARSDEGDQTQTVAQNEAELQEVTRARDVAKKERDNRFNLYQKYLGEAEVMGSEQARSGISLGETEGVRLVSLLSKQNGSAVGSELGLAEAKLWGSVRGEIQGYEQGFEEGINSTEDRVRAINEASSKAIADAELYAQRNFKPVFFEEFVQEEFKKPVSIGTSRRPLKSGQNVSMNFLMEASLDIVPPLSPTEVAQSKGVKTPLDASIDSLFKDVKAVEAKANRLRSPDVTFETPTKIPHGNVSCGGVYKGVAAFKAACEGSYEGAFTQNYVNAAKRVYRETYSEAFDAEFNSSNVSEREARFSRELDLAAKIARAEGVRVGKVEIYQETYASTYKSTYESELVKAKEKSRNDASQELTDFLSKNPLLTMTESSLKAQDFRGDEEVSILGKVKNVGGVALSGPVIVRVTELENATAVMGEAVLNAAQAFAVTDLPELKVKISPTAKTGERLIVRGVVDLPGDLYRATRQEKFELIKVLGANPSHDLSLDYDKSPDIKLLFHRNTHDFKVKIRPTVEEINDGYSVSLNVVGEADVIEFKGAQVETGPLDLNASKEIRFSYKFKDKAKDKTVTLELVVSYLGKEIRKETIELRPH